MASTNKTTNYELSQFEGTDKPSWEADYNADMLSIDTNLKAVSDVADGASGSISTLADRVTTAEGNITTNANDIDALEARADALEAGETSADGRLDAIEAEQLLQNTAIEGNTQLGYNLARPYDSASTYSVGDYVLFQNTLYKCTTAVTTGEAFDPTKWLAIKATDEIATGGYTLPTASASTLGGVKVGSGLAIDAAGVLSNGLNYEEITIDTTNFPINVTSGEVKIYDDYYNNHPVAPTTTTTFTDPTGSLTNVNDNKLIKIGNYRHLQLSVSFSFTPQINETSAKSYVYHFTIDKPQIIDAPSSGCMTYYCRGNNTSINAMPNEYAVVQIKANTIEFSCITTQCSTWSHSSSVFKMLELSWIARPGE